MLLARREHSRAELQRKLLPMAVADVRARLGIELDDDARSDEARAVAARDVETLLDWLEANRHLSDTRFVESRLHTRAARFGNRRIEQELAQHGVSLDADTRHQLRDSEFARARAVWQRKFGAPAADAAERARQMRFLAQRGFSAEVVRRVVRDDHDDA